MYIIIKINILWFLKFQANTKKFYTEVMCLYEIVVNFMCQLGWAIVSRDLVKHYYGFFCEVFLDEISDYSSCRCVGKLLSIS